MGSNLWSVDILINGFQRPMLQAEQYKDWITAANLTWKLAKFLKGLGQGIKDFPQPPKIKSQYQMDIRQRGMNYPSYLRALEQYYQRYSPEIFERMGIHIQEVLANWHKENHPYDV